MKQRCVRGYDASRVTCTFFTYTKAGPNKWRILQEMGELVSGFPALSQAFCKTIGKSFHPHSKSSTAARV